ncbi:MAG: hypothetical protein NT031_01840, partial [Planctomycetota bacterium]|nr:hypothetical protein [Planctomycetota bacterium]
MFCRLAATRSGYRSTAEANGESSQSMVCRRDTRLLFIHDYFEEQVACDSLLNEGLSPIPTVLASACPSGLGKINALFHHGLDGPSGEDETVHSEHRNAALAASPDQCDGIGG